MILDKNNLGREKVELCCVPDSVLELVRGGALEERLRRERSQVAENFTLELYDAVEHLHCILFGSFES